MKTLSEIAEQLRKPRQPATTGHAIQAAILKTLAESEKPLTPYRIQQHTRFAKHLIEDAIADLHGDAYIRSTTCVGNNGTYDLISLTNRGRRILKD